MKRVRNGVFDNVSVLFPSLVLTVFLTFEADGSLCTRFPLSGISMLFFGHVLSSSLQVN